jgi:DNA-binding MarR family transcriptional regulator
MMPATEGEAFTFRNWPFYWLARADGRYLQAMEMELQPLGLDVPRWRVLMTLHEDKCLSVSEIAGYAIIKLSTMTKIVQRMQADGLVVCRASSADRRVTEVLLTDAGYEAGRRAWQAADRVYKRAFRSMTPRRIRLLNEMLQEVSENLR